MSFFKKFVRIFHILSAIKYHFFTYNCFFPAFLFGQGKVLKSISYPSG
jgi:hypothetical protein